jgi:ligand-binding sensor domain-containing protein
VFVQDSAGVFQHLAARPLDAFVTTILVEGTGAWIGTTTGLHRIVLDRQRQSVAERTSFAVSDGLPAVWIQQVSRASNGDIWVVTNGGLARMDKGDERAFHVYNLGHGIADVATLALAEDDRHFWIGTTS